LASGIADELRLRLPGQRKTQREALALLGATMLEARTANLMTLATFLPRNAARADMRDQWIARFIDNHRVDCDAVMEPFARAVLATAAASGRIVLIMDQTKASERHQVLMLAVRFGERALPLAWRVAATQGAIGFTEQKTLLDAVTPWLPSGAEICLMADRFYGTPDLIELAKTKGWSYRLRLKANLRAVVEGRSTTLAQHAGRSWCYLSNVELPHRRVVTNIGIIRDPGHDQPWLIAMSEKPGYLTTLDDAARWGIEPMFSDFKSRGFGLEQSQLRSPDRLARLLLVMGLALHVAVSTGCGTPPTIPPPMKKSPRLSAQKSPSRQTVLVHPRAEMHCSNDPVLSSTATTLENDSN
jgi:hypothetical protein